MWVSAILGTLTFIAILMLAMPTPYTPAPNGSSGCTVYNWSEPGWINGPNCYLTINSCLCENGLWYEFNLDDDNGGGWDVTHLGATLAPLWDLPGSCCPHDP